MSEQITAVAQTEPRPQLVTGRASGGIVPRNADELWRLAVMISKSGMTPKGMERPETIAVAITMGMELGLSPMAAVQNIAVINNRPSVWGDAALGIVQASGLLVEFSETPIEDEKGNVTGYVCRAVRRGNPEPIVRRFTRDAAKTAGLAGKAGPWSQYPERMMQMRARSWCLRDGFADVLRGLSIGEEAQDCVIDTPATVEPIKPGRARYGQRPALQEPAKPLEAEVECAAESQHEHQTEICVEPEQFGDVAGLVAKINAAIAGGNEAVNMAAQKAVASAGGVVLEELPPNVLADIAAIV